jgi:hypothetical protein
VAEQLQAFSPSHGDQNQTADQPVLESQKGFRPGFRAVPGKTKSPLASPNYMTERVQVQESLLSLVKDDSGANAAVKDMIGLAVLGNSYRFALQLFFGAVEFGLKLDISFLCRDLLKSTMSTNDAERLLLFFHAVIEFDQLLLRPNDLIPFQHLCGGKVLTYFTYFF